MCLVASVSPSPAPDLLPAPALPRAGVGGEHSSAPAQILFQMLMQSARLSLPACVELPEQEALFSFLWDFCAGRWVVKL